MAKTKKTGDLVNQTISTTAPLVGGANLTDVLNFSITKANTTTDGYVSATDWNTFNGKQDALGFTPYDATNPDGYITSSALTGLVPYTGATANVDLGTNSLTASDLIIDHASGSGVAASITKGGNGEALTVVKSSGSGNVASFTGGNTFISTLTTPTINGVSGNLAFANAVQTSGAITAFTFTKPNNTTQTASTQINGFVVNGGTRQWNTGAIATQSENVWGATTYSFVGASTITNAYGNVFNAPIAGTNATITNNWAAQFNGNVDLGAFKLVSPLHESTSNLSLNATGSVLIKSYNAQLAAFATNSFTFTPILVTSGLTPTFTFTKPNNTNQTASASIAGWNFVGGTRQWATGNITTQNENIWGAVTYSFIGASTITNAYGNVFNAPIVGANCTITNNFAAHFNGQVSLTQTVTTETLVQTRSVTIVINGTTYKLLAA